MFRKIVDSKYYLLQVNFWNCLRTTFSIISLIRQQYQVFYQAFNISARCWSYCKCCRYATKILYIGLKDGKSKYETYLKVSRSILSFPLKILKLFCLATFYQKLIVFEIFQRVPYFWASCIVYLVPTYPVNAVGVQKIISEDSYRKTNRYYHSLI